MEQRAKHWSMVMTQEVGSRKNRCGNLATKNKKNLCDEKNKKKREKRKEKKIRQMGGHGYGYGKDR